ncbi:hypothetical protein SARC_11270 [Sphaeroforma arctica JP610]|uniref:Uncharacterized protein n=1 Tax=Sphaeroforma arctica JP610 TaxID=667725 RepID=A0A0L0FHH0_9EUKA|nr:hypothetical protein SARC_11270 [Sphaeroforma arctica JP610]KNC76219.1 hypothetical protein SARC_11270 [Sphaeroforma arctica JP610]|eukprot:XP_014150121.1 hypothetical protein SARC_11270 [Sphaeroforma arctica JP610]
MSGAAARTAPPEYMEKRNHKLAALDAKNKKKVAALLKKEEDAKLKGDQKVAKLQAQEDKALSKQDKFQAKIVKVDNKTQSIVATEPNALAKQEKVVLKCEEKLKAYLAKLDKAKDNPKIDYKQLDAMNDTVIKIDVKITEAKQKLASLTEKNRLEVIKLTVEKDEAQAKIDNKLKSISLKKRKEEYKRDLKVHSLQVKKAVAMRNDALVSESLSKIRGKTEAPPPAPPVAAAPVAEEQPVDEPVVDKHAERASIDETPPAETSTSEQPHVEGTPPERPPSRAEQSHTDDKNTTGSANTHEEPVETPARESNAGHVGDNTSQHSEEPAEAQRKQSSTSAHKNAAPPESRGSIPQETEPYTAEGAVAT